MPSRDERNPQYDDAPAALTEEDEEEDADKKYEEDEGEGEGEVDFICTRARVH